MNIELIDVIHWVGIATTIALCVYAYRRLSPVPTLRPKFLLALVGLTSYANLQAFLMPTELLSPFGVFDMWFRHACFYAGQLFFFIFVNRIIFWGSSDRMTPKKREGIAVAIFLLLASMEWFAPHHAMAMGNVDLLTGDLTPYRVLLFLTDQGIQHVVAVVFFLISIAILRSESLYADLLPDFAARRKLIGPFLVANGAFILLHVWEFLFESRNLFPFVPDEMGDYVEYAFFFVGLAFMLQGVRLLWLNRDTFATKPSHEAAV